MRPALLSTALVLAAMAAPAPAHADRGRHRSKPSAPVTLTITSSTPADGVRIVVLDATPTRDVPAIELVLGDQTVRFGATRAGQHRTLEARIPADTTDDVIGAARVGTTGAVRTRAIALQLAAKPAAKPYVLYTVKGRAVAEVRE
jgi:hypothetical protein